MKMCLPEQLHTNSPKSQYLITWTLNFLSESNQAIRVVLSGTPGRKEVNIKRDMFYWRHWHFWKEGSSDDWLKSATTARNLMETGNNDQQMRPPKLFNGTLYVYCTVPIPTISYARFILNLSIAPQIGTLLSVRLWRLSFRSVRLSVHDVSVCRGRLGSTAHRATPPTPFSHFRWVVGDNRIVLLVGDAVEHLYVKQDLSSRMFYARKKHDFD